MQLLLEIISSLSAVRFQNHCPKIKFQNGTPEEHDGPLRLGEQMSFILMWGECGSILFKCHYDSEVVKTICTTLLGQPKELITLSQVKAYMNEFCNLVGGYFRGVLEGNGFLLGMSLPFSASGEDELTYYKMRKSNYSYHKWTLYSPDDEKLKFYCTTEIYLKDGNPFLKSEIVLRESIEADRKQEDNGDIEFL